MLKQRLLTAIILIPATLLLLFYLSPLAFGILTALIALGGAWEWSALMEIKKISGRVVYVLLVAGLFFVATFIPLILIFLVALTWWLVATLLLVNYSYGKNRWIKRVFLRGLMGFLVLVPCWCALNYIRNLTPGIWLVLFLFILIWGADSAAYFVGRKWGKTKLAATISPGKSVQGVFGAIVFAVIVTLILLMIVGAINQIWPWMILLSLLTVLFSVIGDLFESMLKRQAGLKDSGRLLPGHGGLLDRIDSLTAAAPIFALGIYALMLLYLR